MLVYFAALHSNRRYRRDAFRIVKKCCAHESGDYERAARRGSQKCKAKILSPGYAALDPDASCRKT